MAKYEVNATKVVNYYIEVTADSQDEAISIADGFDEKDWKVCGGEFTIDYAIKL